MCVGREEKISQMKYTVFKYLHHWDIFHFILSTIVGNIVDKMHKEGEFIADILSKFVQLSDLFLNLFFLFTC